MGHVPGPYCYGVWTFVCLGKAEAGSEAGVDAASKSLRYPIPLAFHSLRDSNMPQPGGCQFAGTASQVHLRLQLHMYLATYFPGMSLLSPQHSGALRQAG